MKVIILSLVIILSSTSVISPKAETIEQIESHDVRFLECFSQYWHALENAVVVQLNNLVGYIENIFECPSNSPKHKFDVTLVGFVNFADGIGRHPILFKECLGDQVKINFLSTRNIPAEIEDAQLGLPRLNPAHKQDIGAVSILTDILADKALSIYKKVPNSPIKVAYTMFESTEIPKSWVQILNKKFDLAVVPDQFLIEVYKKCGVQIPIFVLPLPLMLHEFLEQKQPKCPHTPFVFGMTGGFWERKNHMRVLEAFAAEYGNRTDVKLRLHGRFGEETIINALAEKIAEYNLTNVELIVKPYTPDEYLEFFKSLDCYVFLSMGEGFSITPREALACGKPCILTNNTAQKSICNSGTVRVVPSNIPVPAMYDCHYNNDSSCNYGAHYTRSFLYPHENCPSNPIIDNNDDFDDGIDINACQTDLGYFFDCTVQDAQEAMRDVYQNYDSYLVKAYLGRKWVKRYLQENLHKKYINLVKPEAILLGEENILADQFLMTNSQTLYEKYRCLEG